MHVGFLCLSLLVAVVDPPQWTSEASLCQCSLELKLIADAVDGELDEHTLLEAALIAAGSSTSEALKAHQQQFQQLQQELSLTGVSSAEMAQRLLEEMHRVVFCGSYEASCSDLRRTLSEGDYNCVSATIIYQLLCQAQGVPSRAVAVPAHVFSQLSGPAGVDVQTTCSSWLGPGSGRQTAAEHGPRRLLSDVELVAKVYYNRGVLELQEDRFAEAVRLLRVSLMLDSNDLIAKNNLLAAINNWSLAEANAGDFQSAGQLLSIGRRLDDQYRPLRANDLHVHQQWVQALCRQHQFASAMQILNDGYARRPEADLFQSGRLVVLRLWAGWLWEQGRIEDGFELFDRVESVGSQYERDNAEVLAVTAVCSRLTDFGQAGVASRLVAAACRRNHDPRLAKLRDHLMRSSS